MYFITNENSLLLYEIMTCNVHLPYRRMTHISKFHQMARDWTVEYQRRFRLLAEQMRGASERFVDYPSRRSRAK
jgi:hypothetical protein